MRIRTVLQEFEVHFHPVQPGSNMRGKSEWKQYGDGTYRFKFYLVNIPLADGSWLMRVAVQNKKARVEIENDSGSGVPATKAGQVLRIKSGETVLAVGIYEAE